jgi:ABC-type sulfate/molybdate transport systems ATPase subunit
LLVCRFRKRLPEFDLDIALEIGDEILVLVGRTGSGKSTTLNVIAGLTAPSAGLVTLEGRTLVDVARKRYVSPEERGIGYLFQHFALFPHLSVADNVGFGLFRASRAERDSRVQSALDFLDLRGVERARPMHLSGGERQRVALARALVTEPDVLLLDEPLASLDVESRARIRRELRALLQRLAIPSIVVSHDYDDARVLGDRIAAMDRGAIVQLGTAGDLAAHPANDFVAALTGTNVALISPNGAGTRRVAFDPWAARLSTAPSGSTYEWRGEIVDMRPLGAHVRVGLRGEASIKVDIESGEALRAGYKLGDVVFASVPADKVRSSQ